MKNMQLIEAVAYFRTSSLTNVGEGKDSEKRQREAVTKFAKTAGYKIIAEYADEGVKGSDAIDARPGFTEMLDRILSNGVRTIIVENASRFSRDLITQETGFAFLAERGVTLIAADSPAAFLDDTPTATLIRQILGAVAQFDKAALVAKLRGARERKQRDTGVKCGGRKNYRERNPEAVALAKKLARYPIRGHKRSLREIAQELRAAGYTTSKGKPYAAAAIAEMLAPRKRGRAA